jgi:uncharacterized protein
MQINLTEILQLTGIQKNIPIDIEMETFNIAEQDYLIVEKNPFDLIITNMGDKELQIEGEFTIKLVLICDRCMGETPYEMNVSFIKNVNMNDTEESRVKDLNEMSYISGYTLDVEELIYDEMVIHFPMKVLCKDDCKGICNKCGANLNTTDCGCDTTQIDPRMAKILDIFNNSKEV